MRKLILMVGLVVVAIACGETAGEMLTDAGQMMMDAGNDMIPDAGAQQGGLVLPCDLEFNPNLINQLRYATVSVSEVPGAFTAFRCDFVDSGGNPTSAADTGCKGVTDCPLPDTWDCEKIGGSGNTFLADGSYWFFCGNAAFDSYPTSIRLLR